MMNVGLAQLTPKLGNVASNLERHLEMMEESAEKNVDLLVFPELSLHGYRVRDLAQSTALNVTDSDELRQLSARSAALDMDIVVGFVEVDSRYRYYISAAYIAQGELLHVHRKVYLPTYGMFDDSRYFGEGKQIRAFDTRFGRVGMLICEDFWHVSAPYLLWMDGADILIHTSASPGRGGLNDDDGKFGSTLWVERVNQSYASTFTNYVIHANRTGFEDGVNFWGGSFIYNPDGALVVQAPYYEQGVTVGKVDLNQLRRTRARLPLLRDERIDLTLDELNRIKFEQLQDE